MGDEDKLDLDQIRAALSNLLGIPDHAIFEYEGANSLALSPLAYNELTTMVELPDGYELTDMVRIPNPGEYFLDLSMLVMSERVVVYKAIEEVDNLNLILDPVSTGVSNLPVTTDPGGSFDFFLCMLQGGAALYKGATVRLLLPALDVSKKVVIVNKGEFELVDIKELQHVDMAADVDEHIPVDNLLRPPTNKLNHKLKGKYSDRFNITFDEPE